MDAFKEQLVKSLKGGHAFVSYKDALDGVDPAKRSVRPGNELHSVYELLEHMRLAQKDLLDFALDPDWKSPEWPAGFWPEEGHVATDEEWDRCVRGFFRDQNRAVKFAKNEEIDLLSWVPQTENTYLREIMLIIEHNAYHLGQLVEARKALGDWK